MEKDFLQTATDKLAGLIVESKRLVVFTGAGISTESGIPDFRGPDGLWSKYDPDEFTYQKFIKDREVRKKYWQMVTGVFSLDNAQPNMAHYAIAELEKLGKLDCIVTQNVDDLHQKAGNSRNKVLELHGNVQWTRCLSCGQRYPIAEIRRWLDQGVEVPECQSCKGIIKTEGISFGEPLPQDVLQEAMRRSSACDIFIVIGSTLLVTPAAYMPQYALQSKAKLGIINLGSTPLDRQAHLLIPGKAGEVMPLVITKVKDKLGEKSGVSE